MQLAPLPTPQLFQTKCVTTILESQPKVTYYNIIVKAQGSRLLMIRDIKVSRKKWENIDKNLSEFNQKCKEDIVLFSDLF